MINQQFHIFIHTYAENIKKKKENKDFGQFSLKI